MKRAKRAPDAFFLGRREHLPHTLPSGEPFIVSLPPVPALTDKTPRERQRGLIKDDGFQFVGPVGLSSRWVILLAGDRGRYELYCREQGREYENENRFLHQNANCNFLKSSRWGGQAYIHSSLHRTTSPACKPDIRVLEMQASLMLTSKDVVCDAPDCCKQHDALCTSEGCRTCCIANSRGRGKHRDALIP